MVSSEKRKPARQTVPHNSEREGRKRNLADEPTIGSSTVKDVAKLAGVSVASVSRVANRNACVSESTRVRVLEAISLLQYHPNSYATELARASSAVRKSRTIRLAALSSERAKSQ